MKGEMILRASSRVRLGFGGAVGAVSILKGVNNAVSFSSALRFFELCCRVRVINLRERERACEGGGGGGGGVVKAQRKGFRTGG